MSPAERITTDIATLGWSVRRAAWELGVEPSTVHRWALAARGDPRGRQPGAPVVALVARIARETDLR